MRRTLVRAVPRPPVAPAIPQNGAGALVGGAGGGLATRDILWPGGAGWPTAATAVTPGTITGLPAAQRALNLIAGTACQLPLSDRREDGTTWGPRQVLEDPWPQMGRAEWLTYQLHALMVLGDAMALPADYDSDGFPRQLVPIDPRYVQVRYDTDAGAVVYDVLTSEGITTYSRTDVWHAKGLFLTSDGLRGVSTVHSARVAWQAALAVQQFGLNAYGSGVPSGIVKVHLREIEQAQADTIKAQWTQAFVDRVPAVLSELMDFTPIAWSPHDAEFLQVAQLSTAQVAFLFNLDPTDLDTTLGSSMTYANREQRAYDRLLSSIGPLLIRIEQAFRFCLPRDHYAKFDKAALLWSDASTRAYVEQTELANGTVTINEVRRANGLPAFGSWADQPFATPAAPPTAQPPDTGTVANA